MCIISTRTQIACLYFISRKDNFQHVSTTEALDLTEQASTVPYFKTSKQTADWLGYLTGNNANVQTPTIEIDPYFLRHLFSNLTQKV